MLYNLYFGEISFLLSLNNYWAKMLKANRVEDINLSPIQVQTHLPAFPWENTASISTCSKALISGFSSVLLPTVFVGMEFYKPFQILCEKVIHDGSG